jgi:hypothetical protein
MTLLFNTNANDDSVPSMENPPLVSHASIPVVIGETFIYKGERCEILRLNKNKTGFWYSKQQSGDEAFMNFWFYKTIPSQVARSGFAIGLHRKQLKKQKILRAIEGLL